METKDMTIPSKFYQLPSEFKNKTFGFHYLKPELAEFFNGAFSQFTGLPNKALSDSFSKRAALERGVKGRISNGRVIEAAKYIVEKENEKRQEVERINNERRRCIMFNDGGNWQKWESAVEKKRAGELERLRMDWMAQAKWAHCRAATLDYANTLLVELEAHCLAALEELGAKRDQLPDAVRGHYVVYLSRLRETIEREKSILHRAIIYRLVAHYRNETDESAACLAQRLMGLGIGLGEGFPPMPTRSPPMLADDWRKLANIIAGQGECQTMDKFKNEMDCFQEDSPFSLQLTGEAALAPRSYVERFPAKLSRLGRFLLKPAFPGNLFAGQSNLLLRAARSLALPVEGNSTEAALGHFEGLGGAFDGLSILNHEIGLKKEKNWFFRLFRRRANGLINAAQGGIRSQQGNLLRKQVLLLGEAIKNALRNPMSDSLIFWPDELEDFKNKFCFLQAALSSFNNSLGGAEKSACGHLLNEFATLSDNFNALAQADNAALKMRDKKAAAEKALYALINAPEQATQPQETINAFYSACTPLQQIEFCNEQASNLHLLQNQLQELILQLAQGPAEEKIENETRGHAVAIYQALKTLGQLIVNVEWENFGNDCKKNHGSAEAAAIINYFWHDGPLFSANFAEKEIKTKAKEEACLLVEAPTAPALSADAQRLIERSSQQAEELSNGIKECRESRESARALLQKEGLLQLGALNAVADEALPPKSEKKAPPPVGYESIADILARANEMRSGSEELLRQKREGRQTEGAGPAAGEGNNEGREAPARAVLNANADDGDCRARPAAANRLF